MLNWGIKDPNSLVFSSESLGKSSAGRRQSRKELKYSGTENFFWKGLNLLTELTRLDRPVSLLTQLSCFDKVKIILAQRNCVRIIWLFFSELCQWGWVKVVGGKSWGSWSNNGENTATPTGREEEPTWKTHQKSFRTKCVFFLTQFYIISISCGGFF